MFPRFRVEPNATTAYAHQHNHTHSAALVTQITQTNSNVSKERVDRRCDPRSWVGQESGDRGLSASSSQYRRVLGPPPPPTELYGVRRPSSSPANPDPTRLVCVAYEALAHSLTGISPFFPCTMGRRKVLHNVQG